MSKHDGVYIFLYMHIDSPFTLHLSQKNLVDIVLYGKRREKRLMSGRTQPPRTQLLLVSLSSVNPSNYSAEA